MKTKVMSWSKIKSSSLLQERKFFSVYSNLWFQFLVIYTRTNKNRYMRLCLYVYSVFVQIHSVLFVANKAACQPASELLVTLDMFIHGDSKNKPTHHYSTSTTIDMNVGAVLKLIDACCICSTRISSFIDSSFG